MTKTSLKRIGWFEAKPLNLRLPLYYSATLEEFSVVLAGTAHRAHDQRELEEQVRQAIRDSIHLTWVPTIEVRSVITRLAQAPQFGFSANRKHVCQLPHSLGFKQVGWAVRDSERLATSTLLAWDTERDGPFAPPCTMRGPGIPRLFLPYSDVLWTRLSTIQQQVAALECRFFSVLATSAGIEQLVTPGMTLAEILEMPEVLR